MSNDEMRGMRISNVSAQMTSVIPLYVKELYNQNRNNNVSIPKYKILINYHVTHPSTMFTMDLIPDIGEVMDYKGKLVRVVKVGRPSYFDKLIEEIRTKSDLI